MTQSEQVRNLAKVKYVLPALQAGKTRFSVAVRDLLRDLAGEGFPPNNTPQVCSALRKRTFLRELGIEIESIDGPPKKTSPTVVYHYRTISHPSGIERQAATSNVDAENEEETAEAKALRLTEGLRGLLKEEMAEFGGAEGFLRWVRGYDEEDAA
ncbi:MAG: hypothetical protein WBE72_13725 [Terracidiphilus sp.]